MASPWKSVFKELPPNGTVVWIRVTAVYGELALAEFQSIKKDFKVLATNVIIPVYQVSRWKYQ